MALGAIFGRFWGQVGGQVGAKLVPKSEEVGYQDDVKKSCKIWSREGTQVVRRWYAVVRKSIWSRPLRILHPKVPKGQRDI